MQIRSIGIDLGKTTFHLIALGSHSRVVIRKSSPARNCWPHRQPALVIDRHGSLRGLALFGASAARTRARGTPDSGAVCATVR